MRTLLVLVLILGSLPSLYASADRFEETFGGGKAELSSYKVIQPRYGEPRQGHSVFIFVPEHTHAITRIKIEDYAATPERERIPVVKLNRALYFNTGVYAYSVVTSAFAALQPFQNQAVFFPMKISITANEWCGNFYEHLLPESERAKRVMHSYFEGEGDKEDFLPAPKGGIYEDLLPILIRELKGPWLKEGETRELSLLPSLWSSRMAHAGLQWQKGFVRKKEGPKDIRWTWKVGNREVNYWVEAAYPHYITKWEGPDGEKGERIKTIHVPYWKHNHNVDAKLRETLGLPK